MDFPTRIMHEHHMNATYCAYLGVAFSDSVGAKLNSQVRDQRETDHVEALRSRPEFARLQKLRTDVVEIEKQLEIAQLKRDKLAGDQNAPAIKSLEASEKFDSTQRFLTKLRTDLVEAERLLKTVAVDLSRSRGPAIAELQRRRDAAIQRIREKSGKDLEELAATTFTLTMFADIDPQTIIDRAAAEPDRAAA